MTHTKLTMAEIDELERKREHCIDGPREDYIRVSQEILDALPFLLAAARELEQAEKKLFTAEAELAEEREMASLAATTFIQLLRASLPKEPGAK